MSSTKRGFFLISGKSRAYVPKDNIHKTSAVVSTLQYKALERLEIEFLKQGDKVPLSELIEEPESEQGYILSAKRGFGSE